MTIERIAIVEAADSLPCISRAIVRCDLVCADLWKPIMLVEIMVTAER
jgi:hypothetical protein